MHDRPHFQHAARIVEQFRQQAGSDACVAVGEKNFDALTVLIESALNTSVMSALNETIDDINELQQRTQRRAACS